MSDIIKCEDCGLRHDRLYICDVRSNQAWARKVTALESERDALRNAVDTMHERIVTQDNLIVALNRALKAQSTPWQVIRKLSDGNFLNERIEDVQQGPDGVRITLSALSKEKQ